LLISGIKWHAVLIYGSSDERDTKSVVQQVVYVNILRTQVKKHGKTSKHPRRDIKTF